jgi:hypothetical protein
VADWIVVMSDDNWKACARVGLLGLGRNGQTRLGHVGIGDRLWVYVNRKYVDHQTPRIKRVRALARVTGPVEYLEDPPWRARGAERFPYARKVTIEAELDISEAVVKELSFAKGRLHWGVPLLNAPLALTSADVRKLERARGAR